MQEQKHLVLCDAAPALRHFFYFIEPLIFKGGNRKLTLNYWGFPLVKGSQK